MERKKLILISFFLLVCVETNGLASPECDYCISPPCKPTVMPESNFDAKEDMKKIKAAITARGGEETLMQILTSRSESQRMAISAEYITTGETLLDAISNKFQTSQKLWVALLTPLPLFYVEEIRAALKDSNVKQKYETLYEIFTSLPNCAIREISTYYRIITGEPLKNQLGSGVWSVDWFLKVLVIGNRDEKMKMDEENIANANNDAKTLADLVSNAKKTSISGIFGMAETNIYRYFVPLFSSKSFPYLKKVLEFYDVHRKNVDETYESLIKDIEDFKNDIQIGSSAIIRNVLNQKHFFARELKLYLNLFSVSDDDKRKVVRILRTRCEVDLEDIKTDFEARYSTSLRRKIQTNNDIRDEYKKSMMALVKT